MTFDDGILNIYSIQNISEIGDKPKIGLIKKSSYFFGFDSISYNRYYSAIKVNEQIDNVVRIWQDRTISINDICILEDGLQYKITFIQHVKNDNGLNITRLTLTRIDEKYEIINNKIEKSA